jgi:hypothetical protein
MAMLPTELPDFPDTPAMGELRFHLRELHWDLTGLVARLRELLARPTDDAAATRRLRQELGVVVAAIEHDAQHHAPRALELIRAFGALFPDPEVPRPDNSAPDERGDGRDPDLASEATGQLASALQQVLRGLEEALATVDRAAAMSGAKPGAVETIQGSLTDVVQVLGVQSAPAAMRALDLAVSLHRLLDPEAAAEEDRLEELETPLREIPHREARTLARCPRCGAPRSEGDRTFDGSFCEACRTRWYEPLDD